MSQPHGFNIREWGDGFWKWTCTGRGRSGRHTGIIGAPFTLDDARREAEQHWAEDHADATLPGEGLPAEVPLGRIAGYAPRPADHDGLAAALARRLRDVSAQRGRWPGTNA